jgi:hypothetical protein
MKKILKKLNYSAMKRKSFKLIVLLILMIVVSCDEPETVVTNLVHPDGSITRKIEMKNKKNKFDLSVLQVPFDSTWTIKDTIRISEKGDTTWIKTVMKQFKNVEEINREYLPGKGANKEFSRKAEFIKKFRWFNTVIRFDEKIDRIMMNGYPVKDYLNEEELSYFYSPESVISEKLGGTDSLKYKTLNDTIKHKTDKWLLKSMVSEWIGKFSELTAGKEGSKLRAESMKAREDVLANLIIRYEKNEKFDSLWSNGVILKEYMGETNYLKFKSEADTAAVKVLNQIMNSFKGYSVRISMPGKLIATNGFIDSSKVLLWPVKSDFFLTEQYEMWAESKISNYWAWIVSGLFLVFVVTGVILRLIRKG